MKTYCFDFDGTVADTIPLVIKTLDSLLQKSGEDEISDRILRKIREEGVEEVFRDIGVPFYKLVFLYIRIKKEMNGEMAGIVLGEDIKKVLKQLKKEGNTLGILTSNSKENVFKFLKSNELDVFDFINTTGLLGKEKEIKRLTKNRESFLYIGDEKRDIVAGKKAKVKTAGVTWGLSSKKALLKVRPDFLLERPEDILTLPF